MSDRVHDTLVAQSRGDAREHHLYHAIFLLGQFVPDLMCISFELNEKVANCLLNITGADIDIMPMILSGPLYWRFLPNWNRPSESTFWRGTFGLFQVLGTREYWFCIKTIISDLVASCGNVLILGRGLNG
jgi:hypothetical protein